MYGDVIAIGADGNAVLITFYTDDEPVSMRLEAGQRDQFIRLYMAAERQAEAVHGGS